MNTGVWRERSPGIIPVLVTNKQQSQKGMSLVSSSHGLQGVPIVGAYIWLRQATVAEHDTLSSSIGTDIGVIGNLRTLWLIGNKDGSKACLSCPSY